MVLQTFQSLSEQVINQDVCSRPCFKEKTLDQGGSGPIIQRLDGYSKMSVLERIGVHTQLNVGA